MYILHHPDGKVRVENATQTYFADLADFAADYGSPLPALPAGERVRFYEPGVIHYTSDGHNQKAAPEGRPWPEGDAIVAALPTLLTKQAAQAAQAAYEAAQKAAQAAQAAQAAYEAQQQQQQTPPSQSAPPSQPAGESQG